MTSEEFILNILNTRGRFIYDKYHEKHHIIPECLGGINSEDNLIDLYPEEHYEVHKLLALENPDNRKLLHAWNMMSRVNNKEIDKHEYKILKESFSRSISGEGNPMYGKNPYSNLPKDRYNKLCKERSIRMTTNHPPCSGVNNSNATKVRCIETGEIFNLVKDACDWCKSKHVGDVCRGVRKQAGGYHWEYLRRV